MFQVVARHTNQTSYVLGEISNQEWELIDSDELSFTRQGIYLMMVDNENPREPAQVLAKFVSEDAALNLAGFLRRNGFIEQQ